MRSTVAALVCTLVAANAHAQATAVLGPGQEDAVSAMLQVEPCALQRATIDRDHIAAEYLCDSLHEVVLRHPSSSDSAHRTERFAIETDGPTELIDALLISVRAGEGRVEWSQTASSNMADPTEAAATWLLMLLLVLVVGVELRPVRARSAYASLIVIGLAMLLVPDWGPLHEHLTFTARSDCALVGCDRERPGWLAPTYHAYHLLLQLVPYTSKGLSALSAVLTLVALSAQLAWLRTIAPRVAVVAVLLVGLHPITLHVAVAHSFWPLALTYLWLGAWLGERNTVRARFGAVCAWALAATTSVAMVGPVLVFAARLAWRDRRRSWMLLGIVAFVGFHLVPFAMELGATELVRFGPRHFVDHALFDPRSSPFGFTALAIIGMALARRNRWALAPTLGIVAMLPALGEPLEVGFPVALIHAFPLVAFAAPLAALAWTSTSAKLRALPLILVVASVPTAVESAGFQLQPAAREQAAIERALHRLPPHSRLVIAPEILEPMSHWDGDPIEVRFPVGFYREGGFDADVVYMDEFEPSTDALIYVGTSLVSFHPSEIDEAVRDDPRRPILRRLGELEPVVTFELDAESHPWALMRVAADTRAHVELGFYRLRRRGMPLAPLPSLD